MRVPTGVVQAGSPGLQNQISEAEVFSTAASMREPPVYPVGHAVLSGKSLRKTLTVPMLLLDISPMTPIDGKYDGMVTFVNGPTAGVAPIRLISAAEMDPVELSSVSVPLNMQGDGEHEAPVVPGIRLADTSNVTMSARAVPAPTNSSTKGMIHKDFRMFQPSLAVPLGEDSNADGNPNFYPHGRHQLHRVESKRLADTGTCAHCR